MHLMAQCKNLFESSEYGKVYIRSDQLEASGTELFIGKCRVVLAFRLVAAAHRS